MPPLFFNISADFALFFELSIIISIAVIIAIIIRLLKQPLIISYIITGLIVGPFIFNFIKSLETFNLFSEIGIAILLFTVGINLSPQIIKQFGKVSLAAGLSQVLFTTLIAFFISLCFGLSKFSSLYVALAMSFSSTIIILKLLYDKGELESLSAKISIGFLLVQDIIALTLLFSIPILSSPGASWVSIGIMFIKGVALALAIWLIAHKILKPLNSFISHSPELLFIFSLGWGFMVAALFKLVGFSLETGALIAGVSLAAMPSRNEISARLTTMRDFFIVVFFIMLGAQMVLTGISNVIPMAIVLSLLVMIGNPIILMILMGIFGYRKKTSFKTGLNVAQISEFSLILVSLGMNLGHVDAKVMSTVTMVGLITIFFSTYMILYSDKLYNLLEPLLSIFEKKDPHEAKYHQHKFPVVLFGCNRIGYDFVESFSKSKKKFLVVDYDPETVQSLNSLGIPSQYGDATDIGLLESIDPTKVVLAVSTIPTVEANSLIIETIRKKNKKATIMVVSHSIKEALLFYNLGADYVILPHFLGGRYAADMLVKLGHGRRKYKSIKNKHLNYLNQKLALGHEHPALHRERMY